MEEDELGTQHILSHTHYVTCARCSAAVPLHMATLVPGDALEEGSEFQYLCPDCQKALADGEKDAPTTLV